MDVRTLTELDAKERRVLGALMEKEQATPDYYPLTLNALLAACNQKTNRAPVMSLAEIEVLNTLRVLQQERLAERETGVRVDRWAHKVDTLLRFKPQLKAILTLLLLRGAQTPGELRARSERLHPFADIAAVEEALDELGRLEPALARALPRQPGQKEVRWALPGTSAEETMISPSASRPPSELAPAGGPPTDLEQRLTALEETVRALRSQLDELLSRLGD